MPSRWLRQRDTGLGRIQRGSPPWIVGLTIIVGGLVLVGSVFLDWGHLAIGGGQVAVSGTGTVLVTVPHGDPEIERYNAQSLENVVSHSGVWVAVVGLLIVAGGAAYLWLLPREATAIAVAVLAGIGSLVCLSYAFNVRRIFGEACCLNDAHYSLGVGVVVACTTTVVLTALGVAAFVWERIAGR
jgi:hypothetical protein